MDFRIFISICMLLLLFDPSAEKVIPRRNKRSLHVPSLDVLSFQRSDVEYSSKPWQMFKDQSSTYVDTSEFGSRSLPLRNAVEYVPDLVEATYRLPLRDAVEKRPPPDEAFDLEIDIPETNVWPTFFQQSPEKYAFAQKTQYTPLIHFSNIVQGVPFYRSENFKNQYVALPGFREAKSLYTEEVDSEFINNHIFPRLEPAEKSNKRIVCYVESVAGYRRQPMTFNPEDVDPFMCTHVIYAFAQIDPHTYEIMTRDEEFDLIRGAYRSITGLKRKNPNLKVLIAVTERNPERFHNLTSNPSLRNDFISSLQTFLSKHKFDGLDFHWNLNNNDVIHKYFNEEEQFGQLLNEISYVFKQRNWILAVSVPAVRFRRESSFDSLHLATQVDFVNVQAYDFHSEVYLLTQSSLTLKKNSFDAFNNVEYAVNYWLKKGLPRSKLVIGIPFFGRTFTFQQNNTSSVEAYVTGPGSEGYYTQNPGYLSYFEICDIINRYSLVIRTDSTGYPYVVYKNQWISYDDPDSISKKVRYINEMNLGGLFVWSIDLDDFRGYCGKKWPLMTTVLNNLKTISVDHSEYKEESLAIQPLGTCITDGVYSDPRNCGNYYICRGGLSYLLSCGLKLLFNPKSAQCENINPSSCQPGRITFIATSTSKTYMRSGNVRATNKTPKVVCYVTNWSFYRKGDGKFVPENLNSDLCTHVIYAFSTLEPESLMIKEFDPWTDIENGLYDRVNALPGTTTLLAIGGWTDSTGDKYSKLVSSGSSRHKFVLGVVSFLRRHGFQGLHLDWNYPICWQSNCRKGPATDKPNFTKLLQELRQEFDKENPPLNLGVAISGYKEVIDVAYDLAGIGKAADFLSVMTYDYHGSWEKRTGHVSPLYHHPEDQYPQYNTNFTMEYLVSNGAPREKLLVGIPFYGQTFKISKSSGKYNQGAPSVGQGDAGEYTKQPGMLAYYEICSRIKNHRWVVSRDSQGATGPYAYSGDQWVGYDDVDSIKQKAEYIKRNGFGGAVAWTVDLDDFQNKCCQKAFPLLRSLNVGLGLLSSTESFNGDCTKPPQPPTPAPPTLTTGFDTGSNNSPTTEHSHWEHFTTTEKPSSTNTPWWMSTTTTTTTTKKPSTWWAEPSTITTTTTTEAPVTWWSKPVTTPSTTTEKVTWWTQSPTTSTEPTWEDDVTTIPTPAVVMPEVENETPVKCESGQYFSDPYNCNAYYRCVLGDRKKQYCAGGLHWNKPLGICDWPSNADCKEEKRGSKPSKPLKPSKPSKPAASQSWITSTTPIATTTQFKRPTTENVYTTPASTKPPVTTLEECESGAYYPHEQCTNFYVCVNGQLVTQKCGPGLHWNAENGLCDWGYKTKCLSRNQLADQTNKMFKENYGVAHLPYTKCQAGSYSTFAGDCSQYLFCLWDKYEAFPCADGLHWNNDQKICDWPVNAGCKEGNQNDDEELTEKPTYAPPNSPTHPSVSTQSTTEQEWWSSSSASPSTTTTTEEVPSEPLEPLSNYYKIVCYFTNWAWYRKGVGKYIPENIDSNLCTHIVYGFAVLDYGELIVKAHDSWADFDNKFYSRVVAYKKKGLKVSLALGGWNDSMGDKYSRLVNSPAARAKFIKHMLEFLEKYDFDGLDLDWEYPKCWQVDCNKGPDSDKQGFAALVAELKEAFRPKNYLLSAAVSPSRTVIDAGYDVPSLAKNFDWIAVMTYDFHGQWDKQTGHVAPLYFHPDDENAYFNSNYSINYWISEGVPRRKIIMGMPLYGQSFQLENSKNNGLNAKAPGPGQAGEFTRAAGFLAYYEICDRIQNKDWTVVEDPKRRMGPYAYKGNQWVSYDDKEMIRLKSEYIRKMDLGGGMIWALDLDDFKNRCGGGKHPLLSTIRKVLAAPGNGVPDSSVPEEDEFESPSLTHAPPPPSVDYTTVSTSVAHSTTEPPKVDPNSSYKVVCYFTNWAWYRQGQGKYVPNDIDPDLCTHIVYGFAVLNGDQLVIKPHDTWADFDNKFYEKVTAFKAKGIKVLIAIGGWNDSAGDKYSRLVNNPSARRRFIENVMDFIEKNNFDGLDLDWEYPKCWQVDCNKGPASDKQGFSQLVEELHNAFKPKGWLLSAAVSPSKRVVDAGYDVPALSRYLDWIAVMCYDYHGQWDKITGHVAPMYGHPEDEDATFNTNFTINYWINQGADRQKIVMGMPTYGQSFSLQERTEHGLNAPTYGGGEAGEETRARGFLSYYEICSNIRKKGWTVVRDKKNRIGPYAYGGDQWVSFDDIAMIRLKSEYIKSMGLGGGMIWALDLDDFKNLCGCENYPLLRTINRVLRNYAVPAPTCELGNEKSYPVTKKPKPVTQKPTVSWETKPPVTRKPIESWETESPENSWKPTTVQTLKPESLPCSGQLFTAHRSNCNQYYMCNQGNLMLQSCPSGLYWNQDHCDWPENSKCHPDATTLLPTTSVTNEVYHPDDEVPVVVTSPKPSLPGTTIDPNGEPYKVVCYFTNWAWYRQEKGKYVPDDIDPTLCTHITYGFAVLDSTSLTIKSHDPWADVDNNFYKKVIKFKSYGIKVLIALGGWNDSLGNKYSRLVNDPQARARFIQHMVKFIEEWGFDGLDLDWEYPKCWQVDCNKGPHSDKQGFASLVAELSAVFKPRGWLLSAAVSPSKTVIDAGYDVPSLSKHFDWIAVMTYDFHGHWDKQTGHVAPLYYYPGDTYDYFNANFSLNYWIELGAPPSKLIMGMPLYGQTFSLADASKNELNDKIYGPGEAGDYTRAGGFMAFYEICERVKRRSWMVTRDPQGRIGPYAINGNQWVSYDDIADIRRKTKFLKEMGLGGGMIWALDLDDFKNTCGCGKHPLLKAMNNELRGVPVDVNIDNCT